MYIWTYPIKVQNIKYIRNTHMSVYFIFNNSWIFGIYKLFERKILSVSSLYIYFAIYHVNYYFSLLKSHCTNPYKINYFRNWFRIFDFIKKSLKNVFSYASLTFSKRDKFFTNFEFSKLTSKTFVSQIFKYGHKKTNLVVLFLLLCT